MDEQDREADIKQHVRERLNTINIAGDRVLNTPEAISKLDEAFSTLTCREKRIAQQQLDCSQLGRRDFLKLLGFSAGTAVAAIGFLPYLEKKLGTRTNPTGYTSHGGYETIELASGEHRTYDLESGEVFENKLIDQTADNAVFTIRSRNESDWTVRNVGFRGMGTDGGGSNSFQLQVSTPSGKSGLIENIWASGKSESGGSELGGIFLRGSHAGHIDVRNTYIEGFGNNAIYASGVGKDGNSNGSVTIENAYHRDNTVSQFRIGSPESVVRNSVGIVNDPEGLRGTYPSSDSRNARGIWGKHFPDQLVKDSSFYISPNDVNTGGVFEARYIGDGRSNGPRAVLHVVNCNVNEDAPLLKQSTSNAEVNIIDLGHNPTLEVIADGGVPTTPEEAAQGKRGTPPSPDAVTGTPRQGPDTDTASDPC